MTLSSGSRLGPYEIQALLGSGGMGEVYKARDTRLDRTVAIKVLPAHVATDPDLRQRFEREARAVAALNHAHICILHDIGQQDGIDYLVMEYLEGQPLGERLTKGALPVDQVLRYAIEIADALDKAHSQGITHRDLKPGNIMLTKGGAKLLDFGLAKLRQETAPTAPLSQLPTAEGGLTAHGTILGTLQYMAPEQLEAKEADGRTDIFAFGTLVYEMATGKKAFEGQSQASVISAIMSSDPPPISALQPMTPAALDRVVKRCLAKDREDRWQTARDLHVELKWIADGALEGAKAMVTDARPAVTRGRSILLWTLTGVVLGVLLASVTTAYLNRAETPAAQSLRRLAVSLPLAVQLVAQDQQGLELSPDGKQLVFAGRRAGVTQLYRRAMDQLEASPIPGTEGAVLPFFSPDGQWVGFFAGGKLKKVALMGGTPVPLCDTTGLQGADWGLDDMILFSSGDGAGLRRVPAAGGSPEPVTKLDSSQGELDHTFPHILPGGQVLLFTTASDYTHPKIAVQSLQTGLREILFDGVKPRFVPTGHIVFARAGSLWAVPFDSNRLEVTGSAAPLVEGVRMEFGVWPYFTIASDGTLVYVPGDSARQLVWVDRKGGVQPLGFPPRPYETPRLSPEGQRLALTIREENHDVWSYELARETSMRLTTAPGEDETPVWLPDGKRLVFAGDRPGGSNLLLKLADGSATEEKLLEIRGGHRHTDSVSPDGLILAFHEISPQTGGDIWVLSLQGDRKPRPFLQTPSNEIGARFSPDGRWIAYMSNESGQSEVYVQAFPGPGGKWKISTEGGVEPVWSRSSRELFYRNGDQMMAVDVAAQPAFNASKPRVLFKGQFDNIPWEANYDVSADGQRFLMIQAEETIAGASKIQVVLNWFEDLKRKVPAKQ